MTFSAQFSTDTAGDISIGADIWTQGLVYNAKANFRGNGALETIHCNVWAPKIYIRCHIPSTGAVAGVFDLREKRVSLHLGTSSTDAHAHEPDPVFKIESSESERSERIEPQNSRIYVLR